MPLPFLAGLTTPTPCASNQTGLFDHTNTPERRAAKIRCHTCPVEAACRAWAVEHKEVGVWGGKTDDERAYYRLHGRWHRMVRVAPPPSVRLPAVAAGAGCGTETAYRRHARASEQCAVCWAAREARLRAEWERRLLVDDHGTAAMYALECRLGVPRCEACREWMRVRSARRRARRAAQAAFGGVVAPVVAELSSGRQAPVQALGRVA